MYLGQKKRDNMKTIFTACVFLFITNLGFSQEYNITFQLNTNSMTESFNIPEINGTFNNWCGACAPMADSDGDGIYSITIPLPAGTIEYKFAADGWNIQETLLPGSSCTLTTGQFTNRIYSVTGDATLPIVCWGSCDDCGIDNGPYNVTFSVDMNDVTQSFSAPEVNGTFNNWCGGCAPMSDSNGDGVWEITIPLAPGSYEYKFAYDSWAGQEALTPGSPCTVTVDAFTNRVLEVTEATNLGAVCWGFCGPCSITNIDETTSSEITLFPNPSNDFLNIQGVIGDSKVEIIDSFGRVVKSIESLNAINYKIDIQELPVGNYIIRNISTSGSSIQKFSKAK
jgi:hypothetical protein